MEDPVEAFEALAFAATNSCSDNRILSFKYLQMTSWLQ